MERKTFYKLLILCMVLVLILPVAFAALQDQISSALEPFKNVNIPQLYGDYWQFWDFTFYLVLFVGILNAAPEKFLGNKASRVLLGIGAAGVSTLGAGIIDFKLGDIGLLFIAIVLTAVGTAAYVALRNIGFGGLSGGLVAFGIVWFYMAVFGDRVMAKLPPEFAFIKDIYGLFGGILLAAAIFAIGIIGSRLFGSGGRTQATTAEQPTGAGNVPIGATQPAGAGAGTPHRKQPSDTGLENPRATLIGGLQGLNDKGLREDLDRKIVGAQKLLEVAASKPAGDAIRVKNTKMAKSILENLLNQNVPLQLLVKFALQIKTVADKGSDRNVRQAANGVAQSLNAAITRIKAVLKNIEIDELDKALRNTVLAGGEVQNIHTRGYLEVIAESLVKEEEQLAKAA